MLADGFTWTAISQRRNAITATYEPVQPYLLLQLAELLDGATFLDVGANIGFYTLLFANHSHITSVLAFEPNAHCAAEIAKNLALNGFTNRVRIHELALSDAQGTALFAFTSEFGGDSGLGDTHLFKEIVTFEQTVRVSRMDDIVQYSGHPLLVKIDVEGHEYRTLRGAVNTLSKNFGFLQLEILEQNPDKESIVGFLRSIGWEKLISAGPDYYFTNVDRYKSDNERLAIVERTFEMIIKESLHGIKPSRRTVTPGGSVESSRRYVKRIKRFFRFSGLKSFKK